MSIVNSQLVLREKSARSFSSRTHIWRMAAAVLASAAVGWSIPLAEGQTTDSLHAVPPAEEITLEQLINVQVDSVFGASRYEQKVTEAPASISIVTADEVKKFGYRTLAEVLRGVRGMYIADDRNYIYLGTRGFQRPGDYNTRMLLLVDGHRVNDNVYNGAYYGHDNVLDVDLIERVEVIRGPGSSIYGDNAFFGVVNVVTKRARQFDGVEVSGEAGSFDTYKGRFSFGKQLQEEVDFLISGSYYTSSGQEELYYPEFDQRITNEPRALNNGMAIGLDGEEAYQMFTSLGYHGLTFSGAINYRSRRVPTASFGTIFNDGAEKTEDLRAYADLKLDHSFSEAIQLTGRLYYDVYLYRGDYPYDEATDGGVPTRVLQRDDVTGDWVGTDWQLTTRIFDRHRLVVGSEFRQSLRQQQIFYYDVENPSVQLSSDGQNSILGFYGQAELSLLTNLTLNAGLRYDYYFEGFGDTLNPRLGLIYSPWKGSAFKALYGEAFRAPSAYEQYYFELQSTVPPLQPETITTYELAYEQYFARHYRFGITGFHYDVDDLITLVDLDPEGTPGINLAFANLDAVSAYGLEFEVEGKLDSGLLARLSYAFQQSEDGKGEPLSNSPEHLVKVHLSVPLYKDKLFASAEVLYHSEVLTLTGREADNFVLVNLTLFSQKLLKNLEASVSVYNLLGTDYVYPGSEDHLQDSIRQDGRSFRIKLTYRF
jgi:iron complex outermembrane receptor protein